MTVPGDLSKREKERVRSMGEDSLPERVNRRRRRSPPFGKHAYCVAGAHGDEDTKVLKLSGSRERIKRSSGPGIGIDGRYFLVWESPRQGEKTILVSLRAIKVCPAASGRE